MYINICVYLHCTHIIIHIYCIHTIHIPWPFEEAKEPQSEFPNRKMCPTVE